MPTKKIAQYIAIGALFLIPIFPLIVANSMFFPFITGKAFYFRILVELAFAAWVVLAFTDAKYRPRLNAMAIAVTAFTVIALLADLLGVSPLRSIWSNFERMEGWITIVHLFGFFLVASSIFGAGEEGKKIWFNWLNMSLLVAAAVAIYGFVQLAGGAAIHQGSSRIDASLGNAAYMAVYMLINAFMAGYMYFVSIKEKIMGAFVLKWVYALLALVFAFLVFETATRGTILGLIGGVLLALAIYAIFGKNENQKFRWISAGILGFIVIVGIVFWINRNADFIQKDQVLSRLANISWQENKSQARGYIWPMAVKGALERPILGWGQENFNYIFNQNYEPRMWSQEQWFDRAHSVFLDWFVAGGFLGLFAYLALYVVYIFYVVKSNLSLAEKSALLGLLAGYAIHNVFVFDNLASYVLFFSMLAFVATLRAGKENWLGTEPVMGDVVEYVVAPLVVILLITGMYFINVKTIRANQGLITALYACQNPSTVNTESFKNVLNMNVYSAKQETREQLLLCAGNVIAGQNASTLKSDFYQLTLDEIKNQIDATPRDARIYTLGGSFLNSVGNFAEAEKLLDVAHQLSPRKQSITFQLATDYINTGKIDQAVTILKEAYESDPTYYDAKAAYVLTLIIAGKEAEAKKIFPNEPGLFESERVAQYYASQENWTKAIAIYEKITAADPENINARVQLARLQYSGGMVTKAIATMRAISKDKPELKDQIEAALKQIQQ